MSECLQETGQNSKSAIRNSKCQSRLNRALVSYVMSRNILDSEPEDSGNRADPIKFEIRNPKFEIPGNALRLTPHDAPTGNPA
jgi:hypothetical protein